MRLSLLVLSVPLVVLAASVARAESSFVVAGDSSCPTPAEVSAQIVVAESTETTTAAGAAVARLQRDGDELLVALNDANGRPVAERRLPTDGSCAELAEVTAVTISTWLAQLRPETPSAVGIPSLSQEADRRTRAQSVFDLGLAGQAAWAEGARALGAVGLATAHGREGWGGFLKVAGASGRTLPVGGGEATWRRWEVALGPSLQMPSADWRFLAGVGLSAGWLSAAGHGFAENRNAARFSPGASALVRVGHSLGAWMPWLGLTGAIALKNEPLHIVGSEVRRPLRPIEVGICLGISRGRLER